MTSTRESPSSPLVERDRDYDTARQISKSADSDELLAELAASTITRRPPGVPPLTHHELALTEDGCVTIGRPHEAGERRRDR